jgi:hypothetical protein
MQKATNYFVTLPQRNVRVYEEVGHVAWAGSYDHQMASPPIQRSESQTVDRKDGYMTVLYRYTFRQILTVFCRHALCRQFYLTDRCREHPLIPGFFDD